MHFAVPIHFARLAKFWKVHPKQPQFFFGSTMDCSSFVGFLSGYTIRSISQPFAAISQFIASLFFYSWWFFFYDLSLEIAIQFQEFPKQTTCGPNAARWVWHLLSWGASWLPIALLLDRQQGPQYVDWEAACVGLKWKSFKTSWLRLFWYIGQPHCIWRPFSFHVFRQSSHTVEICCRICNFSIFSACLETCLQSQLKVEVGKAAKQHGPTSRQSPASSWPLSSKGC